MPLVKTVTRAYPMGKPLELVVIRVIGVEVKELSDQPDRRIHEQEKRLLVRETEQFDERIVGGRILTPLPPEASEMPLKREPEAVSALPLGKTEGETVVSNGCQLESKPRP